MLIPRGLTTMDVKHLFYLKAYLVYLGLNSCSVMFQNSYLKIDICIVENNVHQFEW